MKNGEYLQNFFAALQMLIKGSEGGSVLVREQAAPHTVTRAHVQIESVAESEFMRHNSAFAHAKYVLAAFVLATTYAWQLDAGRVANANCTAEP